jgi:eukaryotic-like serine/threonine-protein kinase
VDVLERLRIALAGRYRIERELGAGGMATVYLAHDLRHDRDVAIKVLQPRVAQALTPERFLQEIHIAAQLQHPMILPLFDSGEADGLYYYVMPRIVGESLRQRLQRDKRLSIEEAVKLGREIAEALDYAHGEGVVHRDIKPENIMLSGGHPLVADFGVARALDSAGPRLTSSGLQVGTPLYMSPEQALGDPLDHRSDLYSLGCVIYELIAGSPPHTGPNARVVLSGHTSREPASLSACRLGVPRELVAVIEVALAKEPADRFQSGRDFARALADTVPAPPHRRRYPRSLLRIGLGVLAAAGLAAVAWAVRSKLDLRPKVDPNLVAVAPFDALSPGLALWREGLMDMLSRNLNGAGPLRVVSPSTVVRAWSGRADVVSAQRLGTRTGAGLSVVGTVVQAGADSVRLSVTVVDVNANEPVGDVEFVGAVSRMDMAVDSLTVGLLAALGRTRAIGAVQLSTARSRSLPALKAYLQGEQFVRRSEWDSAQRYFEGAASLDPTFALALYRIFQSRFYTGTGRDSVMWSYALRAGELNHGLGPRESLMVAADSVLAAYRDAPPFDVDAQRERKRVIATLELANRRFPNDPEVWFQLGRTKDRIGYLIDVPLEQALEALDRAIALDSAFAPAYAEAISFATMVRGQEATRRYLHAYLTLGPKGVFADVARLSLGLMDPTRSQSAAVIRTLDTASARTLYHTMNVFEWAGDSAETYVRIARQLVKRGHDPSLMRRPDYPKIWLGNGLAFRGHLAEALEVLGTDRLLTVSEIAALGGMPRDQGKAVFDRLLLASPPRPAEMVFALRWWARERDTSALSRAIAVADHETGQVPEARFLSEAAQAWRSLAIGDSAAALRQFLQLPYTPNDLGIGYWEQYIVVRLLNDSRRFREALSWCDRQAPSNPFPWDVVLLFERARAMEGLGQAEAAAALYTRVADLWRHGDPVVQPVVAAARAAAVRLRQPGRR